MISFPCPSCRKKITVKDELAGKKGKCSACGNPIAIPQPSGITGLARGTPDPGAEQTLPPRAQDEVKERTLPPQGSSQIGQKSQVDSGHQTEIKDGKKGQATRAYQGSNPDLYDFLAPAEQPDEIGRLGPYRVLQVLGAGGMGVVFRAQDPALERMVALKAMLPALACSPSAKERFFREARSAAALKHPHVVTIHQVGEDRGVPFLAMEFLEGEPLDDRLRREPRPPIPEVLRIGREVAAGLAAAHEKGLIHRDIKPANIWLEGKIGHVKILDFGLARALSDQTNLTRDGAIVGTPAYMAPEQAGGKQIDHRCDLFSLGCVLYRMCTGEMPFKGSDTIAILSALALDDPPPPGTLNLEVPVELSDLVMHLLAKQPEDRPESARAVVDRLDELSAGELRPKTMTRKRKREATSVLAAEAKDEDTPADTLRRKGQKRDLRQGPARGLLLAGLLGAAAVMVLLGVVGFLAFRTPPRTNNPVVLGPAGEETGKQTSSKSAEPERPPEPVVTRGSNSELNEQFRIEHTDPEPATQLAFDAAGDRLLSLHARSLRLWDARSGKLLATWQSPQALTQAFLLPTGPVVAGSAQGVTVHERATLAVQKTLPLGPVKLMAVSADGHRLACVLSHQSRDKVKILELPGGEEQGELPSALTQAVPALGFFDRTTDMLVIADARGDLRTWNMEKKIVSQPVSTGHGIACDVRFNDNTTVVAGHTPEFILLQKVHAGWTAVPPQPDTKLMIGFVGNYPNLKIASPVRLVTFSYRNQFLATTHDDTDLNLWDLPTGKLARRCQPGSEGEHIRALTFSSDGQSYAASLGKFLKIGTVKDLLGLNAKGTKTPSDRDLALALIARGAHIQPAGPDWKPPDYSFRNRPVRYTTGTVPLLPFQIGSVHLQPGTTDADLAKLVACEELREVSFGSGVGGGCSITAEGVKDLKQMKKLRYIGLYLPENRRLLPLLAELPISSLAVVYVNGVKIPQLDSFKEYPELTELHVVGHVSGFHGLKDELPKLQSLAVCGNEVFTDAELESLAGLKKLRTLDLYRTVATLAGIAKFKQALPECEVKSTPWPKPPKPSAGPAGPKSS